MVLRLRGGRRRVDRTRHRRGGGRRRGGRGRRGRGAGGHRRRRPGLRRGGAHAHSARRRQEVGAHVGGVLVAVVAVLGQGLEHDPVEGLGHVGGHGRRRPRDLAHVLVGDGHRGVAREGRFAGEQLVEQAAGRVQVAAGVDDLAAGLLGRQVLGGAHHGVGLGDGRRGVLHGAGDAEVHHLHRARRGQHDVAGLDVPVDDAGAVGVLQRVQDAGDDLHGLGDGHGLALAEELADRVPLDVLHDDVGHRADGAVGGGDLLLARVVDGDDGRVVEGGGGLRLPAEARLEGGVARNIGAQQFNGDNSRETPVIAEVDLGHASAADHLADLVTAREDLGELAGHSASFDEVGDTRSSCPETGCA